MFFVAPELWGENYLHSRPFPRSPNPGCLDIHTGRRWRCSPHWTRRSLEWSSAHRSCTEKIFIRRHLFHSWTILKCKTICIFLLLHSWSSKWCWCLIMRQSTLRSEIPISIPIPNSIPIQSSQLHHHSATSICKCLASPGALEVIVVPYSLTDSA